MTAKITTIEDRLIAEITTLMQNRVRLVDWAPPDWDEDFIKRTLLKLPGVFVIFGGGPRIDEGSATVKIDSQWTIVAATRHVQTAKQRARGDSNEIGCYEIIETVIQRLDCFEMQDIGMLNLIEWNNEFALKLENQALMTQSASFHMLIDLERILDPSDADPFLRFYDTFNIDQPTGAPITGDDVELPQ